MSLCEAERWTLEELLPAAAAASSEGCSCCTPGSGTDSLSELLKSDDVSNPLPRSCRGRDLLPYFFVPTTNLGDTSRSDDSSLSLSVVAVVLMIKLLGVVVTGVVVVVVTPRSSSPDGTVLLLLLLLLTTTTDSVTGSNFFDSPTADFRA